MKFRICHTKNVARLAEAGDALIHRGPGMPGMGLIYGPTGYGKSTAATWFINQCHGVYVRALATWSPSALLSTILRELDIEPRGNNAQKTDVVIEKLAQHNRPLFVDEADYLLDAKRMLETLRDLHDLATVPVILIGMDGIQRKIVSRQQLTGRLLEWVEFEGADMEDARILADQLCEVTVADDLLAQLQQAASAKRRGGEIIGGASARLIVVGLSRIEHFARARNLKSVDAAKWPRGRSFFLGEAPVPTRGDVAHLGKGR
jgi:hypothetical protein